MYNYPFLTSSLLGYNVFTVFIRQHLLPTSFLPSVLPVSPCRIFNPSQFLLQRVPLQLPFPHIPSLLIPPLHLINSSHSHQQHFQSHPLYSPISRSPVHSYHLPSLLASSTHSPHYTPISHPSLSSHKSTRCPFPLRP